MRICAGWYDPGASPMPKISVKLSDETHRLAKIKALSADPPVSLMTYVRILIERDLRRVQNGKRS